MNSARSTIYMLGGGKGGVGKSMTAMALIDFLITRRGQQPILVETDTSNPDVFKAYESSIPAILLDLDEADGWIELLNALAQAPEQPVVINCASRNNHGIAKFGERLSTNLHELQRNLVTFWVINRQRDSLELLHDYLKAMPETELHVLRNEYFAPEAKFELYNRSHVRSAVESRGGRSLVFPDLADRVADELYCNRLTIQTAATSLPLGNRAEILSWRNRVGSMFEQVVAA